MSNEISRESLTVFTVCNIAYLPKALVLADSVWRHSSVPLTIVLFDRKIDLNKLETTARILWIEDMGVEHFKQLAFRYDIVELSTSLKPHLALEFLTAAESVIFLDPDICTYATLQLIVRDLDSHPIVLTPHYTIPQSDAPSESDLGMMRFGSFNLGFFAVRWSPEAVAFLQWWSVRCIQFSYFETQFGLSTDQKWVTIAPCFFPDLYVSFNLGYNVAPWNTVERVITRTTAGAYFVNERFQLVFFHFSNFDPTDMGYLNKRSFRDRGERRPDIEELGGGYGVALDAYHRVVPDPPYAYDYMSAGEYISPTLRRAYAAIEAELPREHDPFDSQGVVGVFARRNRLLETNQKARFKARGFKDIGNHTRSLRAMYFVMRIVLRVVGPNRFYNLSRLLVYLSSFRQNRELWKYENSEPISGERDREHNG